MSTYNEEHGVSKGTISSYQIGFFLSLALTIIAFALVYVHISSDQSIFSPTTLYGVLILSALAQLFIQLFFFLHVGKHSKSHWNLTALTFALVVVSILVGGTLWIMWNLQHINPMPSHDPFIDDVVTPQTES